MLFQPTTSKTLTESNRWNPNADVAELVDALVSGSRSTSSALWIARVNRPGFLCAVWYPRGNSSNSLF